MGAHVRTLIVGLGVVVGGTSGCAAPGYDPPPDVIRARFDPEAKSIPMPNDAVRDPDLGMLDLPNDTPEELARLTPAEQELYAYFETLDGWSSLMSATVDLTGPIDPQSLTDESLQVWRWTGTPVRVADTRVHVRADGMQLTIDPPREGWTRGDRYVVMLRGGVLGARGAGGERLECDAAFYFLRQTERLDTPEHEHAFPGDTRAERMENARKLEEIRADLAPVFDAFEAQDVPRSEVASLWAFTVTERTELAMDKASQRMPLPIALVIDPATGHVDLPPAPWDKPFESEAKRRLAEYTGFGLSPDLLFELTAPLDASTVSEDTVALYRLADLVRVPAAVTLMPDLSHVILTLKDGPLAEATSYVVVVDRALRDAEGREVSVMPAGHFLRSRAPVFVDGASQLVAVPSDDAERLELARTQQATALDGLGRDQILAAWPFTTLTVREPLVAARQSAARLGVDTAPTNITRKSAGDAILDFPLGVTSLLDVSDVYDGTIASPQFLDPRTRAWRGDGGHEVEQIAFTLAVPDDPAPGPIPVVIFGHGLVTERRFVLAVAGELAQRGFASISIDFPYHGTRTYCATGGPISVINPQTGEPLSLNPCESGTTCNDLGRCVDAAGQGNALAKWPVLDLPIASGAVFTDVNAIASTKDHFLQALIDLGALDHSLRTTDWSALLGRPVDTSRIYYAGQSLGGIMGAVFLGSGAEIPRAVLNVPGADLIRMFDESTFFSSHLQGLFTREGIDSASYEGKKLLAVASWIMDAVDPEHVGAQAGNRELLLQMATLDFIIPNASTKKLERATGAPRRDYIGEHGFITIPLEPAYYRGVNDLANWLEEGE